jgi:hypothetical protein
MGGRQTQRSERNKKQRQSAFHNDIGGAALILYLDTSSLAKLYIAEAHSNLVANWVEEAEIVATCR